MLMGERTTLRFTAKLGATIERLLGERGLIPGERLERLLELARVLAEGGDRSLLFVCTHNSRRSHLGAIWAHAGARWFGMPRVRAYSGGTESTAFHPNAVGAVERAGFLVTRGNGSLDRAENPVYEVRTGPLDEALPCFSKVYSDPPNPREGVIAVMVCASADAACPVVPGAEARFAIRYEDPKSADGTADEARVYDERCAQVGREVLEVFRAASAG